MAPRYIIVEKLNEVYLKLEADADLRRNLSDWTGFSKVPYKSYSIWKRKEISSNFNFNYFRY